MKVLVYALQSSGASLFTYFLGQRSGSIAIIDFWAGAKRKVFRGSITPVAPAIQASHPVVVKAVVAEGASFEDHIKSFKPDRSILFLREPRTNYASLRRKPYHDHGGAVDKKFRIMEQVFLKRERFDAVLTYEDFVNQSQDTLASLNRLGWESKPEHFSFDRSISDITEYNMIHSRWCKKFYERRWGTGNIHGKKVELKKIEQVVPGEDKSVVENLCPSLCEYFDQRLP